MRFVVFFILVLLIFISNAGALRLSLSPSHVSFLGEVDEKICEEIVVASDKEIVLYGDDKWALGRLGDGLRGYDLNHDSLGLEVIYPKEIYLSGERNINFCVKSKSAGKFYGAFIYKSDSGIGIGNFVEVEIMEKNNFMIESMILGNSFLLLILFVLSLFITDERI